MTITNVSLEVDPGSKRRPTKAVYMNCQRCGCSIRRIGNRKFCQPCADLNRDDYVLARNRRRAEEKRARRNEVP